MLIFSWNREEAFNIGQIDSFYITKDGRAIKASGGQSRGRLIGEYSCFDESKKALEILMERISKDSPVIYTPTSDDITERVKDHWHHETGKKAKRHGGS